MPISKTTTSKAVSTKPATDAKATATPKPSKAVGARATALATSGTKHIAGGFTARDAVYLASIVRKYGDRPFTIADLVQRHSVGERVAADLCAAGSVRSNRIDDKAVTASNGRLQQAGQIVVTAGGNLRVADLTDAKRVINGLLGDVLSPKRAIPQA